MAAQRCSGASERPSLGHLFREGGRGRRDRSALEKRLRSLSGWVPHPPDRTFEVHGKRCRIVYDRGRVALRRFAAFGESLVSLCGIAFLENGRFG